MVNESEPVYKHHQCQQAEVINTLEPKGVGAGISSYVIRIRGLCLFGVLQAPNPTFALIVKRGNLVQLPEFFLGTVNRKKHLWLCEFEMSEEANAIL